jgi:hypothetical protein
MTGHELVRRIQKVLLDLSVLSEVGAVRLDSDRVRGSGSRSSPPPGVGARDLRDVSLAAFWRQRFHAGYGNEGRLLVLCLLAERDLARAQRRQPGPDPHETRESRERRVLVAYEGLSPLEAALAEDCSESWIRKVRNTHERDPADGSLRGVT